MLFDLGSVVATPAAIAHLERNQRSPIELVTRHLRGDWGDLEESDKVLNDQAINTQERILSAYFVDGLKLYVITEWDRSYTTLMLASEY